MVSSKDKRIRVTQAIVAVVLSLATGGVALGFFPGPQGDTEEVLVRSFTVQCIGTGLLCEPAFERAVTTSGILKVHYQVPASHCGPVKLHLFVDGQAVETVGPLGPPGSANPMETGLLDLGPVEPGTHTVSLQAEGIPGGCIEDQHYSWGGDVRIVVSPRQAGLLPAPGGRIAPAPDTTGEVPDREGRVFNLFIHGRAGGDDLCNEPESGDYFDQDDPAWERDRGGYWSSWSTRSPRAYGVPLTRYIGWKSISIKCSCWHLRPAGRSWPDTT